MSSSDSVLTALSNSSKGQIKYDSTWHSDGRMKEIIEECTSPPKLSVYSSPKSLSQPDRASPSNGHVDNNNVTSMIGGLGLDDNRRNSDDDDDDSTGSPYTPHTPSLASEDEENTTNSHINHVAHDDSLSGGDFSRKVIITKKTLAEEEEEYRRIARLSIEDRRRLYEDHTAMLQRQTAQQYNYICRNIEKDIQQETKLKEQVIKQGRDEISQKQQRLREEHKRSAKVLDNKMVEAQQIQREEEEKERKKQQALKDQMAKLEEAQKEFLRVKALVSKTIASCSNPAGLPETICKYPEVMVNLSEQVEAILADVRTKKSCNIEKLTGYLSRAQAILEFVRKQCEKAEEKATKEREQQQKQQEEKQKQQEEKLKQQQQLQEQQKLAGAAAAKSSPGTSQASAAGQSSSTSDHVILVNSVFQQTFVSYTKAINQQKELEKRFQALMTDPPLKKIRFELQKAVNTPINAISPESGRHLRDKLDKIIGLLKGNNVVVGGKTVCAQTVPGGIDFCMNLFAQKMVNQGDTQVSSQYDSAFAFAAVMVGVWCELPAAGELLLTHFYLKCPYLVPYYIPLKEGQSSDSYYSSLGYNFVDGEMEKQDMFLKRMSGLMRLYASVFVSTPPRQGSPHPHGLDKAWAWITQVVTLEPRPDITATLLYDFLEVTAHSLSKQYKKQFQKLIVFIIRDYLPQIRNVTLQGAGGPVSRLEIYLEKISKGKTTPPKGMLPQRFWLT